MLPRALRMLNGGEFTATVRHGRRIGGPTLVLHVRRLPSDPDVRLGFVVSKAVGNAVARNRVKRRLRHLAADRLAAAESALPGGSRLVVRALPTAASEPDRLVDDFDRSWSRAVRGLATTPRIPQGDAEPSA